VKYDQCLHKIVYCALALAEWKLHVFCFRISFKTFSMLRQTRHTSKAQYISKVCTLIRPVKFKLTEFSIWQTPGLDVCLHEESNGWVKFAAFSLKRFRFTFSFLYQKNHYTYSFKIANLFTLYYIIIVYIYNPLSTVLLKHEEMEYVLKLHRHRYTISILMCTPYNIFSYC
jgi:hypothetical protein